MKVPECEYGFYSKSRTLSGIIDSPLKRFILTHPSVHCLPSFGRKLWLEQGGLTILHAPPRLRHGFMVKVVGSHKAWA